MEEGLDRDDLYMRLFEAAAAFPAAERDAYVRNACAGDTALAQELLERLVWQDRMGDFLSEPLIGRLDVDGPFQPGELVCERFRIVGEIAEGGMGIVYEAIDEKLDQRRALKCAKPGHHRRLPPEARNALRVTHENVCRVYEMHTAETSTGPVDFLAMEYIEGETLAARIARNGPFPQAVARDIARQVCLGLAAIHREGILHRDLKSNNIMLTGGSGGSPRAVITDFGFAREPAPAGKPKTLSSGSLRGGPAYIAPEIWRGESNTEQSDLYAMGVILYEIVTGRKPFPPNADWKMRLVALPPPPSRIAAGVVRSWDAAILGCLEPDPTKRLPSAGALLEKLSARSGGWRWRAALAALAAMIAAAIWLRPQPPPDVRLAILPFQITASAMATGLADGMLEDFSDRLAHTTTGGGGLAVIPLRDVVKNGVTSTEQARGRLGASHVVQGRIDREGDRLLVESVVTDARTKAEVSRFRADYSRASWPRAPTALAGSVINALRLKARLPSESIAPVAYAAYAQGLYYCRRDNNSADLAIPKLQEAVRLDPSSALPYAALAEAYWVKYKNTEIRSWLDQALAAVQEARSRNPNSAAVRIAAGLLNHSMGWNDRAVDDFRGALELEPANAEAWMQLGIAYEAMNDRAADAAAAFQRAVELQPLYYAPHLQFGLLYYRRADYAEAEKQFLRVTQLAPELAQGFSNLGGVYVDMRRFPEAERALGRSLQLAESRAAIMNLGAALAYEGRDAEALVRYERALAIGPPSYPLFLNLGDSYRRTGQPNKALHAYTAGQELAERALSTDPSNGYTRAFFGYFCARLRSSKVAEREIAQALQFAPEDQKVLRRAVLTYDCLGLRNKALDLLPRATPSLLAELNAHPDLAEFRHDPRFMELLAHAREVERRTKNGSGK